jgi:hypothetical protein
MTLIKQWFVELIYLTACNCFEVRTINAQRTWSYRITIGNRRRCEEDWSYVRHSICYNKILNKHVAELCTRRLNNNNGNNNPFHLTYYDHVRRKTHPRSWPVKWLRKQHSAGTIILYLYMILSSLHRTNTTGLRHNGNTWLLLSLVMIPQHTKNELV